jgi:hypothetical protein
VCVCVLGGGGVGGWGKAFYPSYTYKEKRKFVISQSKQNTVCVQTSYMFRLHIANIRLNTEP